MCARVDRVEQDILIKEAGKLQRAPISWCTRIYYMAFPGGWRWMEMEYGEASVAHASATRVVVYIETN